MSLPGPTHHGHQAVVNRAKNLAGVIGLSLRRGKGQCTAADREGQGGGYFNVHKIVSDKSKQMRKRDNRLTAETFVPQLHASLPICNLSFSDLAQGSSHD